MPFKAGEPPRSPHDWLCKFCVTSSGNPCRNNGFRRECHRCHLAKGEAFKARSEKRELANQVVEGVGQGGGTAEGVGTIPTSGKEV